MVDVVVMERAATLTARGFQRVPLGHDWDGTDGFGRGRASTDTGPLARALGRGGHIQEPRDRQPTALVHERAFSARAERSIADSSPSTIRLCRAPNSDATAFITTVMRRPPIPPK
jgi:hypothetical protein